MGLADFWHEMLVKLGMVKPNTLYLRLKKLHDFFSSHTTDEIDSLDKINLSHQRCYNEDKEIKLRFLDKEKFYFQSDLGTVQISLKSVYPRAYRMEYSDYAGTKVFVVYANEEKFDIEGTVDSKNVDLAILELEEYLSEKAQFN